MSKKLAPLVIGDLEIPVPIIQGGMGIQISTEDLASAVANAGGAGTIAAVALGMGHEDNEEDFYAASKKYLRESIQNARKMTKGAVGVNIMHALSNFADLVKVSVEEKVDFIASGAGLPTNLPEFDPERKVKLLPIVSSVRAAKIIFTKWIGKYKRVPDAVIVEGPLAGGHLGFSYDDIVNGTAQKLEDIVKEILEFVKGYEEKFKVKIPVIAGGGIFDGKDIAKFLKLGASGVQMGTRFVATDECKVDPSLKQAYLDAKKEDVKIMMSPVGLPGRVVSTPFFERVKGKKNPKKCKYLCLGKCGRGSTDFCIADSLYHAAEGTIDESIVFAGENVWKVNKVVPVQELMDELVEETEAALA